MLGRLMILAAALNGALLPACADTSRPGDSSTADVTGTKGEGSSCATPCNAVCQLSQLSCTSSDGGSTGEATISVRDAKGCTGMLTAPTETVSLWIHCDECRLCAEHQTECFATIFTPTSFSYLIATKARTITCTKK